MARRVGEAKFKDPGHTDPMKPNWMEVSWPLDVFSRAALAKLKWCRYSIALASTMHSLHQGGHVDGQKIPENTYTVF